MKAISVKMSSILVFVGLLHLFHLTTSSVLTFEKTISDNELIYAAESRNYIADPDTLFVTCR